MSMPWFRMYAEFAGDPVVQSLAFEDQRHYTMILCLKCNGTLDRELAPRIRESVICRGLGLDPNTAAEAKRRLMDVGLVDSGWQPIGWDKRQYASDVSTTRVRNYRKNKNTRNGIETFHETLHETPPRRFGNGPDTDTEADTETELKTTSAEPLRDSTPPVITIPLVDKTEHPIHHAQIVEWIAAYPAVDVPQKLREIRQWNIANPTRRKTRKGILRHITDWLAREQDRGGKRHETHQPVDNSAPARVRRAYEQRERERAQAAERVD